MALLNEQPFNPGGVLSDQTSRKFDSLFSPPSSITGRLIFPPLLPRHVKIAGRPLASREESHASLMRPRPFHRLQPYVAETPCSSLPRHRSPMGIPLISVFYSIFSSLSLSLSLSHPTVVRFSARSLSGFRIDFSCGGFWQPRENEEEGTWRSEHVRYHESKFNGRLGRIHGDVRIRFEPIAKNLSPPPRDMEFASIFPGRVNQRSANSSFEQILLSDSSW